MEIYLLTVLSKIKVLELASSEPLLLGLQMVLSRPCVFFFFFLLFGAAPIACGGSQVRGQIGAAATGLCHSHGNVGSKLHLRPTPHSS